MSKNSIRLICPNESCINKSIVYRSFDAMKDFTCKNCNSVLKTARTSLHRDMKRNDSIAKKELAHEC